MTTDVRQRQFWDDSPESPTDGVNDVAENETPTDGAPRTEPQLNQQATKKQSKKKRAAKAAGTNSAKSPKKPKVANGSTAESAERPKAQSKTSKPHRPFPHYTVQEALVVAEAIRQKHSGEPLEPELIGKAIGSSWRTAKFFYLASAARDYGLTEGTRNTKVIGLTELGRQIVYPESPKQLHAKKVEAFLKVSLFKQVHEHYKGGALPEMQYASGVLSRVYGLDASLHEEFCRLYHQNSEELAIQKENDGTGTAGEAESAGEAEVVRQGGKYTQRAFIIMPFSEKGPNPRPPKFFDEVFASLITPACNAAGFGVETARTHGSDVIHHTIIRKLVEADLVIADLTDHNPNVLFELGIRIAIDRPVLLVRAIGTPAIFDVDQLMRVCEYDPRLWKSTIDQDIKALSDHVRGGWRSRETNPSYMKILKTGQAVPAGG